MDSTAIVSYVSLVLGIGSTILLGINHKRVRSVCCGLQLSASLDVESTTPVDAKKEPLVYNSPGIEKKAVTFKEES
jgi:hypothetical protein